MLKFFNDKYEAVITLLRSVLVYSLEGEDGTDDVVSRFTSAIHNNELKSADMEGILIILLSFAASRQSDVSYFMSKLGDRLNNTSSVTSAGLAATSTMLQ
eukprot:scaffold212_cov83-Alexandrium_tamarense.AAC.1